MPRAARERMVRPAAGAVLAALPLLIAFTAELASGDVGSPASAETAPGVVAMSSDPSPTAKAVDASPTPSEVATGDETTASVEAVAVEVACPTADVLPAHFDDVPSTGAHAPGIDCLWWYGLSNGYADGTYRPLGDISRAAFATLLVRLLDTAGAELPASPPDAFTDDDANVHQSSLNTLAALGILGGSGDGTVDPARPVKRGQLASMLTAAWPHLTGETLPREGDVFPDDDGNLHEEALDRLGTIGLLLGDETGAVLPEATGTRAQLATMLARVLARVVDAGAVDPPTTIASEPVQGVAEVTVASVDPNPSVYAVDETVPVDQKAVDAFVAATTRWLDAHLTALAAGQTGALDARLVAPISHERWLAATTELLWRETPASVLYRIDVRELGAPLWASVEVVVTRGGEVATWEVLVAPAGDDVSVLADGPATEGADRA